MSEALSVPVKTPRPGAHGGGAVAFQITVLVLFFVSCACGLIYEVLWARLLTLSFGVLAADAP